MSLFFRDLRSALKVIRDEAAHFARSVIGDPLGLCVGQPDVGRVLDRKKKGMESSRADCRNVELEGTTNRAHFLIHSPLTLRTLQMSDRPLKRLKVSFKDEKLVMPVPSSIGKVSSLLAEATLRFRAQRLLAKDDSFIQVRTLDGYIVNPNDNVDDVIEQGDHLVLVNRAAWIADFKSSCQPTYWYVSHFSTPFFSFSRC